MDPVMDFGHVYMLVAGADEENQAIMVNFIKVGDIAVYQRLLDSKPIIHRVIDIGADSEGRFFVFRGDNTSMADPVPVRDAQIEWLSVGVVY